MRRGGVVLASVAALAVPAAVGCGKTVIDDAKVEVAVERELESSGGKEISSVECPSGVEVESGATLECAVERVGGGRETATVRIVNEDADYRIVGVKPAGGGGEE